MCLISVIIPSFNRAHLLRRALDSVFKQSYLAHEVIVVDDGSTDDTRILVTDYPQVNYIYQSNQGVSAARNQGIQHATGEWLAFLDSDDEWLQDKLQQQMSALNNSAYQVCHTEEIWIRKGIRVNQKHKHKKKGGWIFKHCLPLCVMSPSSMLIHRDVFKVTGLFNTHFPACEDYDLWLKITAQYPVLLIETPCIKKYGGHQDQLSQQHWGMDRFRIQALNAIITRGNLSNTDHIAAIDMLIKKATIMHQGALKRKKLQDAAHYEQLIDSFVGEN